MSFEEAVKEYLNYVSKRHKKQGFVTLASNFNSRIIPYFKEKNIEDITKFDIIEWQNTIYSLNFKNCYNFKLYVELNAFMQFCCDNFNLKENVVSQVGNFRKKYEEKKTDFYNLKEFNLFIKGFNDVVYKTFFELMFFTGTRPGEAMALKFSDLKDGYISISKTLTTKGGITLDSPKNQSSYRKIKLDKIMNKKLLDLKFYYPGCNDDYFIFGGKKPLNPSTTNRRKKEACINVGIRPITLHQFRHSHATLLLQKGIMVNEVSRRLGHSKTSTTLNIYAHTDLTQEKRVYNTLNSMRFNIFDTLASNFKNIISILKHF